MGFQHLKDIVHEAASRKGGKIKVDKGFAKNTKLASEAGRKGMASRWSDEGRRKAAEQEKVVIRDNRELVDELFRDPEVVEVMKRLADE